MRRAMSRWTTIGLALLACVAVGIYIFFMTPLGFVLIFLYEVPQAREDLIRRHREAAPAINRVYAFYATHNAWPSDETFKSSLRRDLPADWQYTNQGDGLGPVMMVHGSYHMRLVYRFDVSMPGTASDVWVLSFEGDKSTFRAEDPYEFGSP